MTHERQQDVNFHVVGAGALRRAAASLGMAGRGNMSMNGRKGAMVSGGIEEQALKALCSRIERREFLSTEAVSAAAREELEKVLHGTAQEVAGGTHQQLPLSRGRDDGEDMPKTHRSGMVGMEGLND
ncbi:MAG: hypothetical protein PHX93_06255 [Candidatus Peribacteraceae bacterium]|jgi:phosphopantothenate synthetase|nr:hypothetical protein [Candidatus Peribacteraceae bacterium]